MGCKKLQAWTWVGEGGRAELGVLKLQGAAEPHLFKGNFPVPTPDLVEMLSHFTGSYIYSTEAACQVLLCSEENRQKSLPLRSCRLVCFALWGSFQPLLLQTFFFCTTVLSPFSLGL